MSSLTSYRPCSIEIIPGHLYVVATPIGNLSDITLRALDILRQVDHIAAEDTRHSARLLQHFNITTPMIAYHDHSGQKREQQIIQLLQSGSAVALIADAGTPLISDPGYTLVTKAIERGIIVQSIPGPCALVSALSISGLPTDRFVFEGFLPAKSAARTKRLLDLQNESRTLIFYESSHRILASLESMSQVLGEERQATLCRELTKTYETCLRGSLKALIEEVARDTNQQRGEFVVMIGGHSPTAAKTSLTLEQSQLMTVLAEELSQKQAAVIGARLTGIHRRTLYQWLLLRNDP